MKLPSSLIGQKAEGKKPVKLLPRFAFLLLLLLGGISLTGVLIQRHAASATASTLTNSTPLSPIWYFADGEVGAGFQQLLTLNNPDSSSDCQVQVQYLTQGSSSNARAIKPLLVKSVGVPHGSRVTLSANVDLNVPVQQHTGLLISTIVTVSNTNANVRSHHIKSSYNYSPGCAGIVAERPMYFTYRGIQSGSDVMGATRLDTSFYFADVPTKAGSSSFVSSKLSILNPPGGSSSLVTATYYANGSQVGVQSIIVASGARGTLYPDALNMPTHVTASITATQPVLLERSSYMSHMAQGVAGVLSGAVAVVGSSFLSNDWLFAEGYTSRETQENLVLGNPTGSTITATVKLQYQNGHTQQVSGPVAAYSQVIVDVNQLNAHPTGTCDVTPCVPTASVSAEVTGTNKLVVERQMFFHYQLSNVATPDKSVDTDGWSDVVGQVAPGMNQASFAEGYVNTNYNTWLVLQNPTNASELVWLDLYNGLGNTYEESVTLPAHSRTTVNVTKLVITSHLAGLHDGTKAYQISMSVYGDTNSTIFVAERPMYFNTGNTGYQGGTDVIGFSGASLNGPWGITTGADHNQWFTDYYGNHIGKISQNGTITLYNQGLTVNSEPNYITLGPDGNLWFTEYRGNRIGMITPAGVITEYSAGLTLNSGPEQITKGPDGNLWFTEYDGNRIGKITTAGVITEYSAGLSADTRPEGITKGPDNNLWFTEYHGNRIGTITPAGVITEYNVPTDNSEPQGITAGTDGKLWFTEYNGNKIASITIGGTIVEHSGLTSNSWPAQITEGPNGYLYFTESNTSQIGEIDSADGDIYEFSVNMVNGSYPWDITMDQYDNLWFTEYDANQIGEFYWDY